MTDPNRMKIFLSSLIGTSLLSSRYWNGSLDELRLTGCERVLEVGAGGGAASVHLARRLQQGGHLTVIASSPARRERTRRKLQSFRNVTFIGDEIPEAGFLPESFDAAVSDSLFHTLPHHDRSRLIRSVAEALTGKGKFLIREPIRKHFTAPDIRRLLFDHDMEEHGFRVSGNTYDGIYIRRKLTW